MVIVMMFNIAKTNIQSVSHFILGNKAHRNKYKHIQIP